MKVTKQELLESYVNTGTTDRLVINKDKDVLVIRLTDHEDGYEDFKNSLAWLEEITFVGNNELYLGPGSTLTGAIYLENVKSDVWNLSIIGSRLCNTKIVGRGGVTLNNATVQAGVIQSDANGDLTTIKDSALTCVNVTLSAILNSTLICKNDMRGAFNVSNSDVRLSVIYINRGNITDKTIRSIVIDADEFEAKYFSINHNGEQILGHINRNEKVVIVGEKKYNLGSWEEQFVKKEQNLFIKMMNQKKLEMMNMFFDSLAFK